MFHTIFFTRHLHSNFIALIKQAALLTICQKTGGLLLEVRGLVFPLQWLMPHLTRILMGWPPKHCFGRQEIQRVFAEPPRLQNSVIIENLFRNKQGKFVPYKNVEGNVWRQCEA